MKIILILARFHLYKCSILLPEINFQCIKKKEKADFFTLAHKKLSEIYYQYLAISRKCYYVRIISFYFFVIQWPHSVTNVLVLIFLIFKKWKNLTKKNHHRTTTLIPPSSDSSPVLGKLLLEPNWSSFSKDRENIELE